MYGLRRTCLSGYDMVLRSGGEKCSRDIASSGIESHDILHVRPKPE